MPKFMYTIIILTLMFWGIWINRLNNSKPDSTLNILIFLGLLFFSLILSFSIPIYFYLYKKASTFTSLRLIYRRSLKWSLFFSSGIVLLLTLKAFSAMSFVNAGLLIVLYAAVLMHFKKKDR